MTLHGDELKFAERKGLLLTWGWGWGGPDHPYLLSGQKEMGEQSEKVTFRLG